MPKAVIYLRVSSKEQKEEGYSIPAQRKLLLDFARANGFKVVKEYEDNETAKSAGRANFGEMIEFIKQNKDVEVILVEKTDRLYRNFKDYVTIDDLGVTVYLVKESEILGKNSTSHQKFIHGIKVLMAKNFIDNLSEETKKGMLAKAESGVYPNGMLPVGYKLANVGDNSYPVVDEANKDLAIQIFELYASGQYSLDSLIKKIKDEGLFNPESFPSSSRMKVITKSTLYRILHNPFYYGDFLWKGKLYHGNHTPLISKQLWDKVQGKLLSYHEGAPVYKYNSLIFAFKGLLTCGECGRSITAERKTKLSGRKYVFYHCTKFNRKCEQGYTNEEKIDQQMLAELSKLNMPQKAIDYVTNGLKQSLNLKRNTEDKAKQNLEEQKQKLENRMSVLYEDRLDRTITKDFYDRKSAEYETKVKDLEQKISRYTQADFDYYQFGSKILELANKASFLYKNALPEEKRELLGFLLSNSQLKDEKVLINYKKPFDRVLNRVSRSDWGG